jgi:hypothetical protein
MDGHQFRLASFLSACTVYLSLDDKRFPFLERSVTWHVLSSNVFLKNESSDSGAAEERWSRSIY